ncbi:MAG: hypothetical protein IIA23_10305, partial [Chloroflexi bacterium]|nr:hypothetical protein [Chloroflexota bacterium]
MAHASAGLQRGQPFLGSLALGLSALTNLDDPALELRQLLADSAVGRAYRFYARQVRLNLLKDTGQRAHHERA